MKRLREVLPALKREGKDPRFEDLSGKYNPERFRKQYAFLFDEALPAERSQLKAAAKKVKNPARREELSEQATRLDLAIKEDAAKRKKQQWESDLKAKERAAVKAGKKPFYLKKSEKRKAELVSRFQDLKESGKLDRYMAKRRKKNAAKDHRYVPAGRREAT